MNNGYPPTALETDECPPHLWECDEFNVGRCNKRGCGAVKDFGKMLRRQSRYNPINLDKYRKGGRKRKEVW